MFMKLAKFYPQRRNLLIAASLGIGLLPFPGLRRALAATGILAIDTPSPAVADPAGVVLIAITLAGSRLVATGEHGVIIYSDDNGVTWTQASVPVEVTLTCVKFATPMLGWAAGHYGVILNTLDGGKTWTLLLDGIQADQLTLAAAQAAVADNSTAPGAPFAMKRANVFMAAGPDKPFLCIAILDAQSVIVFGAYRLAMKTTDGGKTWVDWSLHVGDRLSHNIYDTMTVGANIYLTGEAGLVFCSTDGGDNFVPLAPTAEVTLYGIVAANDGSLIVYGVAGNGFRSTDGGKTWTPLTISTQDNLTAARVLKSGELLITNISGSGFFSKDNGATFAAVQGLPPTSIYDFQQAPDSSLIFISDSGVARVPLSATNI
jgi:photosystem II stability/assembly factor-like uncharacterized protein